MWKWYQILLFGPLDYIIHGDKTFLHLWHHPLLSFECQFLISLDLIMHILKFCFNILPEIIFIPLPNFSFSFYLLIKSYKYSFCVFSIWLRLIKFDFLKPLPLILWLRVHIQIFIPMVLYFLEDFIFNPEDQGLYFLSLAVEFIVLSITFLLFEQGWFFNGGKWSFQLSSCSRVMISVTRSALICWEAGGVLQDLKLFGDGLEAMSELVRVKLVCLVLVSILLGKLKLSLTYFVNCFLKARNISLMVSM